MTTPHEDKVQTTFYWYDYKMFGLNTRTDRPALFAGIRTDMNLNPIGEPDIWYCKPSRDYLPSPQACLLTGITPQIAEEQGLAETEFARRIYERLGTPGTISVGYNSLKMDDEATRFLFWRNFYDACGREWKNGCSRWDLFPFVLACWALRPEGVNWPDKDDSEYSRIHQKTFRLERLTRANGLSGEGARSVQNSVLSTVALARLLSQEQPKLWAWALNNRNKQSVAAALASGRPCVWIDIAAGQHRGYIRAVQPVSINPNNRNEFLVWDLSRDPDELIGMQPETIARRAFGRKEDLNEGEQRLALRALKINTFPFVCADLRVLTPAVCERFNLDIATIVSNGQRLTQIQREIADAVIASRALPKGAVREKADADAALYENFISPADQNAMECLHESEKDVSQFSADIAGGRISFEDPRLTELFFRYRARNYPQTLSEAEKGKWSDFCRDRLHDGNGNAQTLERFFDALDELAQANDDEREQGEIDDQRFNRDQEILDALYEWGEILEEGSAGL